MERNAAAGRAGPAGRSLSEQRLAALRDPPPALGRTLIVLSEMLVVERKRDSVTFPEPVPMCAFAAVVLARKLLLPHPAVAVPWALAIVALDVAVAATLNHEDSPGHCPGRLGAVPHW